MILMHFRYFFSSNSGVDGCANKHEPGYEHMEWLRIQLQQLRERGMKAILMGHVPPARVDSKESWDETCWQKYTLWQRQFRDVIVGSLYGHMNIDHFMLQDFENIGKDTEKGRMASGQTPTKFDTEMGLLQDGEVTAASASDYLINLRQAWAQLPAPPPRTNKKSHSNTFGEDEGSIWKWCISKFSKQPKDDGSKKSRREDYLEKIGGKFAERYAATLVAPSVVPNYFPTLRIIEYNISGLEQFTNSGLSNLSTNVASLEQRPIQALEFSDDEEYLKDIAKILKNKKKHKGRKKGPRKYKFKIPQGPSKSAPPGPAYSPQPLTWTRYVQYFANLTHINNDFVDPQHKHLATSEDPATTESYVVSSYDQSPHTIFGLQISPNGELEHSRWKEGKHGKHQGKRPREKPHPNEFVFEVEYDTAENKGFKDLTVRRWVEYARKIGQGGSKANVNEDEEEDADEEDESDDEDMAIVHGGKKHKKHKKHHKKKKASKEWFTFVKRAFVGTMDPKDIETLFGAETPQESQEEMMEL